MGNKDTIINDIQSNINKMVKEFNLNIESTKENTNDLKEFYLENLVDNEFVENEIKNRNDFIKEYPIDKILDFSKEDYCLGLESSRNSFCKQLEYGKYEHTGFCISGFAGKSGFFYKDEEKKFKGKNNKVIEDENVEEYWNKFKTQLHDFLKEMENAEPRFDLDSKYPLLGGSGGYMFLTKLLCMYYPDKYIGMADSESYKRLGNYFGIKMDENSIINSYYANKIFRERIPESNEKHGFYISNAIWKYFGKKSSKGGDEVYDFEELYTLDNKAFAYKAIKILKPYINDDILDILQSDEKSKHYIKHLRAILQNVSKIGSEEDLNKIACAGGDRLRYYKEPLIEILGEKYIISNDWYYINKRNYNNRTPFIRFIQDIINKENGKIENSEEYEKNRVNGGKNVIYYGVPGTGKSYEIDKILGKVDKDNKFRVTFHPEFTYNDFVGQLLPKNDKDTGKYIFDFNKGEFTKALKRAYENPKERIYLIIEEMSRGNCAAIFGDIFQLLDRNQDGDEKDWSTYDINNEIIASEIDKRLIHNNSIRIPSNMYIYGTVNTSDQNVYVMDNAFKRRFEWIYVSTIPKNPDDNNINIKIYESKEIGFDIEWVEFYQKLNDFISSNKYLDLGEDKQIGQFFIKFTNNEEENFIKLRDKLLHYLWFDIQNATYKNEKKLFDSDIANFSKLYDSFKNKEKVFSEEFIKFLKGEKIDS